MGEVQTDEFIPFHALESNVSGFYLVVDHAFMLTDNSISIAEYYCFNV